MNRKAFTVLAGAVCLFFFVGVLPWVDTAAAVTLRWAEQGPPTGIRPKVILWMGSEIEKRTEGRVKIQMYWDSTLVKRNEMLRGTMLGTCDIGTINVAFHPKQLHTWGIFNTFMMGPADPYIVSDTKRACFENIPAFNAELERWNQRWITFFNYLPSAIALNKPLVSTKDLKGKRMRAPSAWMLAMLKAIGATPVSMPWGEVYVALERGTIDGVLTSLDSYYRYSIDEVAKHYLYSEKQWQPQPILISMNLGSWKRLNEKDREIILAVGKEANDMENKLNQDYWDMCMSEMKKRSKAVFTKLTDEELLAWSKLPEVESLPQKWVEEASAAGLPAEDIFKQVEKTIQDGLARERKP